MSFATVQRAANSAPSRRDFDGEIKALLARADAARAQAAAVNVDLDAAVEATLQRTGAYAREAEQRGATAADGARARIREQQERFRAGVIASGISLDEEVEASERPDAGGEKPPMNKYSMLMDRRRTLQEHQKLAK